MNDEVEEPEGEESEAEEVIEFYTPEPLVIPTPNGAFVIFDPPSFADHYNCRGVDINESVVRILRDRVGFVNVEGADVPKLESVTPIGKRH